MTTCKHCRRIIDYDPRWGFWTHFDSRRQKCADGVDFHLATPRPKVGHWTEEGTWDATWRPPCLTCGADTAVECYDCRSQPARYRVLCEETARSADYRLDYCGAPSCTTLDMMPPDAVILPLDPATLALFRPGRCSWCAWNETAIDLNDEPRDYPVTIVGGSLTCTVCDQTETAGHADDCPIGLGMGS